jgi:hypothetical protein
MQIIYEPHPVTPERKAELRAKGFRIIDARYAPEGWDDGLQAEETKAEAEAQPVDTAPRKRGRPKKDAE